MLPVRFDDISSDEILRLVEEKTSERKTLEYKEKLMIGTADERAEFLYDISSFANASGGDIISASPMNAMGPAYPPELPAR
jgi:hypothetical protein